MTASLDFTTFFQEVHGPEKKPFPWQIKLAKEVGTTGWPEQLDLPTAAGKTSVLDIAVFLLAAQAADAHRRAPLRIFFVIDRRVVVDQAALHAEKLARALRTALDAPTKYPVLHAVASRLMEFGGYAPLHIAVLRGGIYREPAWYYAPNQPLICLSTVDQVGSRLLFRGYGVSEAMRPVHAGLIGCDSIIFMDEAHLSAPFVDTVRSIRRYVDSDWAEKPLGKFFAAVEMSATQRPGKSKPFQLLPEDYKDPVLEPRLSASKRASLEAPTDFEAAAVEKVRGFLSAENVQIVGVIVNRVGSARAIFEALRTDEQSEVILLTGRARSYDREILLKERLALAASGRNRTQALSRKLVVVATQTIEVGADLDFDALVTEAASLDALRQRFGRLDRLGELKQSLAWILLRPIEKAEKSKDDPIYGAALTKTWKWLNDQARGKVKKKARTKKGEKSTASAEKAFVDFGVVALDAQLKAAGDITPFFRTREAGPVLLPACLDTLIETNPTPDPDPEISIFLHGTSAVAAADAQIVWRADLLPGDEKNWPEILSVQPPRSSEAITVPLFAVKAWLRQQRTADMADLEGLSGAEPRESAAAGFSKRVCRWAGKENTSVVTAKEVRSGDTIVVPSVYGGCDSFGWNPEDATPVIDVGDFIERGRMIGLRLFASRFEGLGSETAATWRSFVRARETEEESVADAAVDELLRQLADDSSASPPLRALAAVLGRTQGQHALRILPYPRGIRANYLLSIRLPKTQSALFDALKFEPEPADEDDEGSQQEGPITLAAHLDGVAKKTMRFAQYCHLSEEITHDLTLAAHLHDIGKADPRFQTLLHGGNRMQALLALQAGKPLAKSNLLPRDRAGFIAARERSGFPRGGRHELISAGLIRQNSALLGDTSKDGARDPDLVSHLIGTHHGYARPFAPVIRDDAEVSIKLENSPLMGSSRHGLDALGSGWTDQFWLLVQRYGYWGLCYLESILRIADHRQSQEEQES
jgi:CRISPR-associated endonuclease/helicase Cas3